MLPTDVWPPSGLRITAGPLVIHALDEQAIADATRAVTQVSDLFADPNAPEVFPWIGAAPTDTVANRLESMVTLASHESLDHVTKNLILAAYCTDEVGAHTGFPHHGFPHLIPGAFVGLIDMRFRTVHNPEITSPMLTAAVQKHGDGDTRYVETGSYVLRAFQGQGLGTLIRQAILSLAFDHLGIKVAFTTSFATNAASLGVSRRCGYWGLDDRSSEGLGDRSYREETNRTNESRTPKVDLVCTPASFRRSHHPIHVTGAGSALIAMLGLD